MEVPIGERGLECHRHGWTRLNPCFSGSSYRRSHEKGLWYLPTYVLILVLVEVPIGGHTPQQWHQTCLLS